jgi:predicted dehydrogenase
MIPIMNGQKGGPYETDILIDTLIEWEGYRMQNRIGIVVWGAGFAGDFHVKGWQNVRLRGYDVEVAAIINRTKSRAGKLMQKYGVERHFHDLEQLLDSQVASQVDAVDICLPPFMHAPAAVEAANAGKHVIVEKMFTGYAPGKEFEDEPIGETVSKYTMHEEAMRQAMAVKEAVEANDVMFGYAENWGYAPGVDVVIDKIKEAGSQILYAYGIEAHHGSASDSYYRWAWSGGGSGVGKGSHSLGGLMRIFADLGFRPYSVSANIAKLWKDVEFTSKSIQQGKYFDIEDYCSMFVRFIDPAGNKPIARADAHEFNTGGVWNFMQIQTSEQNFIINMTPNNMVMMYNPVPGIYNPEELREKMETDAGLSYLSPDEAYAQGQLAEFQNFAECMAARKEGRIIKPKMDIDIATDLVNVIYTGYISAFEEDGKEMLIKR